VPAATTNAPEATTAVRHAATGRKIAGAARSILCSPDGAISVRRGGPAKPAPGHKPTRHQHVRRVPAIDEHRRREALTHVRDRWDRKLGDFNVRIAELSAAAKEDHPPDRRDELQANLGQAKRRRAYARSRLEGLRADIAPRIEACGGETLPIVCRCGPSGTRTECRQWWLCSTCRVKRSHILERDIRKGLHRALASEVEAWERDGARGIRPRIVLLTFTTTHEHGIMFQQRSIAEGWRKLYKRMHEEFGSCPYVGVWEVAMGPHGDGLGHVHLHVATVWGYRDYERVRELWDRACPESLYMHIVPHRRDRRPSTASSAACYLGKYLSKGVDSARFSPQQRADVSAAFYGQHSVVASQRFWDRPPKICGKCLERYRLLSADEFRALHGWRYGAHPEDEIKCGALVMDFTGIPPPLESGDTLWCSMLPRTAPVPSC